MSGIPRAVLDLSETIVAQATAPGKGALAIVRVSGPSAHAIVRPLLSRWPDQPRTAVRADVRDGDGGTSLDRSVVVRYDAPWSFTGEDAVEIMTHGGSVVPATVVAAVIAQGARQALPGEFTRRAVLNGKLDILQAEATGDLIAATSRAAQGVALRQLDGGLSRRVLALRGQLLELEALLAYDIDFPEEDDGPIPAARILAAAEALIVALDQLRATARAGEMVRHGALVVLAGAPNVGKSSLFNALLGQSRAIVTDIPGTTRDAIEAVVDTPGWPLRLVDTAGLRVTHDPLERLGVEVSESYLSRAAVVLACGDTAAALDEAVDAIAAYSRAPVVRVQTKSDLMPGRTPGDADDPIRVSAETGEGLQRLLESIGRVLLETGGAAEVDAPLLTHARQRYAVDRAVAEVRAFRDAWCTDGVPATVAAVHIRTAVGVLEDLVGAIDIDDVLDEVFRRFCVGK